MKTIINHQKLLFFLLTTAHLGHLDSGGDRQQE